MTPAAKHKNYVITSLIYNRCFHILNFENDKQIHIEEVMHGGAHHEEDIHVYLDVCS